MTRRIVTVFLLTLLMASPLLSQELLEDRNVEIRIFSEAPLENIEALTNTGRSVFNKATGEVFFEVSIISFDFDKKLMKRHFNEQYMESDKFPKATFTGYLRSSSTGSFNLFAEEFVAQGDLTIHGITRKVTEKARLRVDNNKVSGYASFKVKTVDYGIKIPSILTRNIAEEIEITINVNYGDK